MKRVHKDEFCKQENEHPAFVYDSEAAVGSIRSSRLNYVRMSRLLKSILIVLMTVTVARAQNGEGLKRIHAAKLAYITDRLHLTVQQSGNFIPVYNDYEREIWETRQTFNRKYKDTNPDRADDATSRQYIDDNLDYQQKVIDIKRRYNDRFLKVISPQQLTDLYIAEREFKQMLMQRLKQNRARGGRFR